MFVRKIYTSSSPEQLCAERQQDTLDIERQKEIVRDKINLFILTFVSSELKKLQKNTMWDCVQIRKQLSNLFWTNMLQMCTYVHNNGKLRLSYLNVDGRYNSVLNIDVGRNVYSRMVTAELLILCSSLRVKYKNSTEIYLNMWTRGALT